MKEKIREFISRMPHFSFLPKEDIEKITEGTTVMDSKEGTVLAEQNKTEVDDIYIVKKGQLSLYQEKDGNRKHSGHIKPGEVFGGITILMNGGISLRTVEVDKDSQFFLVPRRIFLDLCARNQEFYDYFVENYSKHISDKALDGIVESGQAKRFLSGVAPFSFLPDEALDEAVSALTMSFYPKGTILFVQGRTPVWNLLILQKGSAERYYEEGGEKQIRAILDEGDLYGGISILVNDSISMRTMEVTEDSYFYLLPKKVFQRLCSQHEAFVEFFTDTFGKRMLDRTYSSLVSRTAAPVHEGMPFFNQPVRHIYTRGAIFGHPDMTVREAAQKMRQEKTSFLVIPATKHSEAGCVTTSDLSNKVVAEGYDIDRPAMEIMTSPLFTVQEHAMVFEALMTMMEHDIKHLAVTDTAGQLVGIVSNRELISSQGQSPVFMLREISQAKSFKEIADKHKRIPGLVKTLINSGASARNINRLITTISDAILQRVLGFALEKADPPPCSFAFMIMGSEGRGEQTLKTDQDNAIVFEDVDEDSLEETTRYFLQLAESICGMLNEAGYAFCPGEIMAKNPKWCQPLSVWKDYFSKWIYTAEGEDLLQASIFFDFRRGYGDTALIENLREHLFSSISGWSGFLRHMTENALHFKPPLGFFRNFVVESKGKHRNKFDIKGAMMPIVDFTRIYALKHTVEATNTFDRLQELNLKKALTKDEFEELEKAYGFLMQLRFSRQVTAIDQGEEPDNFINPKKLTHVEQTMLKEVFKRTEKFQTKLNFEFIGIA